MVRQYNLVRRDAVIRAVASGITFKAACERLGVSRSTVSKWERDPSFGRDLEAARAPLLGDDLHQLHRRLELLERQLAGCSND